MAARLRIVVAGLAASYSFGGALGLSRLGYEVSCREDTGRRDADGRVLEAVRA